MRHQLFTCKLNATQFTRTPGRRAADKKVTAEKGVTLESNNTGELIKQATVGQTVNAKARNNSCSSSMNSRRYSCSDVNSACTVIRGSSCSNRSAMSTFPRTIKSRSADSLRYRTLLLLLLVFLSVYPLLLPVLPPPAVPLALLPRAALLQFAEALRLYNFTAVDHNGKCMSSSVAAHNLSPCLHPPLHQQQLRVQEKIEQRGPQRQQQQDHQGDHWRQSVSLQHRSEGRPLARGLQQQQEQQEQMPGNRFLSDQALPALGGASARAHCPKGVLLRQRRRFTNRSSRKRRSTYTVSHWRLMGSSGMNSSERRSNRKNLRRSSCNSSRNHDSSCGYQRDSKKFGSQECFSSSSNPRSRKKKTSTSTGFQEGCLLGSDGHSSGGSSHACDSQLFRITCIFLRLRAWYDAGVACNSVESAVASTSAPHVQTPRDAHRPPAFSMSYPRPRPAYFRDATAATKYFLAVSPASLRLPAAGVTELCCQEHSSYRSSVRSTNRGCDRRTHTGLSSCCGYICSSVDSKKCGELNTRRGGTITSSGRSSTFSSTRSSRRSCISVTCSGSNNSSSSATSNSAGEIHSSSARRRIQGICHKQKRLQSELPLNSKYANILGATRSRVLASSARYSDEVAAAKLAAVEDAFLSVVRAARDWLLLPLQDLLMWALKGLRQEHVAALRRTRRTCTRVLPVYLLPQKKQRQQQQPRVQRVGLLRWMLLQQVINALRGSSFKRQ
ncbi:unnamed protein product [Rangifer tarandus platyrhynchus]|uniref:Uncharacterized protein n=1 Tax=Rangifer tarandus platyrhynchus TaxID=3082113 RepID=A0ABN8XJ38_RANTA|nr:unnamed protein product [Rangifer tarandus platyrhynchus]